MLGVLEGISRLGRQNLRALFPNSMSQLPILRTFNGYAGEQTQTVPAGGECDTKAVPRKHKMQNLAPDIYRQRVVIEGVPARPISDTEIAEYLAKLSDVIGMKTLLSPVTHLCEKYGWAGWIHWETSGAHFYAWEAPRLFFSVDIYTCAKFDPATAVEFTTRFFKPTAIAFTEI